MIVERVADAGPAIRRDRIARASQGATPIEIIDDAAITRLLYVGDLIEPMRRAFAKGCEVPQRSHHEIEVAQSRNGTLLVMPAWTPDESVGVKLAMVFPDNAARGIPTVSAIYVMMSATTGEIIAIVRGAKLTLYRTAAVSALALDILARPDVETLLLIGTGALIPYLARAHVSVRRFRKILIWGRSYEKACALVSRLEPELNVSIAPISSLEQGIRSVEVVSAATLSEVGLIEGAWLQAGSHVDLVGSFKPTMREANDIAVKRARVFVDTRNAIVESGDIVQPLTNGTIGKAHILGDLSDLVKGQVGRRNADDITLFKSVGTALADLAAATYLLELVRR